MPSATFHLRVRHGPRDPDRFPAADDALGRSMFGMLQAALDQGLPRPAMLLLRPDQVEQFDMVPMLDSVPERRHRMMSAIAGQRQVECAIVTGVLQLQGRRGVDPGRAAVVFIEWPDNRWWTAWQPVDAQGTLVGEAPTVRAAQDGWPRPGGVGAWFSTARREHLQLQVRTPQDQPGIGLVH